jgi:hypothetical protein
MSLTLVTTGSEITKSDITVEFTEFNKTDRSVTFELPAGAEVSYFSFELSGPIDRGSGQVSNLTLDIGDNGTTDWAYKHAYGPLSYQDMFTAGEGSVVLYFNPKGSDTPASVYLPVSAEIDQASVTLEFFETDYLSPVTELNRPEWHPESPYDYDPEFCVYNDRLFVAYRSYSWRDGNQSDADIMINSTNDGVTWQEKINEITKVPDTEVPYMGGKRSGDFFPSMAVFNGFLYCAWESSSQQPVGSTHGDDRDIIWSRFDGSSWSVPQELTAPDMNAAEDIYSLNPGVKDDYRVQLCTFDNGSGDCLYAIWTANNTGDEEFPEERKGDILISHTVDGEQWTTGLDLTFDDRRYDEDYLPQLVEFETPAGNALFAFWSSNNFEFTNGSDWDILYRYTYDGETWSNTLNLLDRTGVKEPQNADNAIDDDPEVVVYNNQLYVLWRTSNPNLGTGDDIDIVLTKTADGLNWSKPKEVTPSDDTGFNNRPRAAIFNNQLAVIWRTVANDDLGALFLKFYDATSDSWTEVIKVSPQNEGGDDYSPDLIEFQDQLMVAWVTQDNMTTRGLDSDVVVRSIIPKDDPYNSEFALELGLAGTEDIYSDNWLLQKTKIENGKKLKLDMKEKITDLLSNKTWSNQNTIRDEFKNELYRIPITSDFTGPGKVVMDSLEIRYNYSFLIPDQSYQLTGYLKENSVDKDKSDPVQVVLRFETDSVGKLYIKNLRVEYSAPTENDENPELFCISIIIIIIILTGLFIKFYPNKENRNNKKNK